MLPTLATLDDDTQARMVNAGCAALKRLANGEDVEALTDHELIGLTALREAELAAFVTELRRRNLRLKN